MGEVPLYHSSEKQIHQLINQKPLSVPGEKQSSLFLQLKNRRFGGKHIVHRFTIVQCPNFLASKHIALPFATAQSPQFSPERAPPTDTKVGSGTSQSKSGTSFILSNSGNVAARCHARGKSLVLKTFARKLAQAKAGIWPCQSFMCHVCSKAANQQLDLEGNISCRTRHGILPGLSSSTIAAGDSV